MTTVDGVNKNRLATMLALWCRKGGKGEGRRATRSRGAKPSSSSLMPAFSAWCRSSLESALDSCTSRPSGLPPRPPLRPEGLEDRGAASSSRCIRASWLAILLLLRVRECDILPGPSWVTGKLRLKVGLVRSDPLQWCFQRQALPIDCPSRQSRLSICLLKSLVLARIEPRMQVSSGK